jgi:hypothetical protein
VNAADSYKTFVSINQNTLHYIQEDRNVNVHCGDNLKSQSKNKKANYALIGVNIRTASIVREDNKVQAFENKVLRRELGEKDKLSTPT